MKKDRQDKPSGPPGDLCGVRPSTVPAGACAPAAHRNTITRWRSHALYGGIIVGAEAMVKYPLSRPSYRSASAR